MNNRNISFKNINITLPNENNLTKAWLYIYFE